MTKKSLFKEDLNGHPRFYELLETIAELHSRKNSDYAKKTDPLSNFKECEDFGIPAFNGTLVRMSDKWSRIKQLTKKGSASVKGEAITDTLMDMSVYALLAIILYEEGHTEQETT